MRPGVERHLCACGAEKRTTRRGAEISRPSSRIKNRLASLDSCQRDQP
jgi:hypothetical protein